MQTGRYSLELSELGLDKPESDGSLFERIRQDYERVRHSVFPMRFRLTKPDAVIFLKVCSTTCQAA